MPWGSDPSQDDQSSNQKNFKPPPTAPDSLTAGPPGGIQVTVGNQNFNGPSQAPGPPVVEMPRGTPPANGKSYTDAELLKLGLNPALLPMVHRESGGRPNIGWTDVDLSNVPRDEQGFPKWSGKPGPEGNSTAAGILQDVGSTWRPLAKELGIKDFSIESQIKLNNELYARYGERPWAASAPKGWGQDQAAGNDKWHANPADIEAQDEKRDTAVQWMSPADYKALVLGNDAPDKSDSKSLNASLAKGEAVDSIPELTVKRKGNQLVVTDQDGLRRAQEAQKAGVDLIPVAIHGAKGFDGYEIAGLTGQRLPYDFKPVEMPKKPPGLLARGVREVGRAGLEALKDVGEIPLALAYGAAKPIVGLEQYAANAAQAFGLPGGATAAQAINQAATNLQEKTAALNPDAQGVANVADVGMTAAVPAGRLAEVSRVAQPVVGAAAGALGGALQPVPNVEQGGYGAQMNQNALTGGAFGAALPAGAEGVNALRNLAQRFVTPATLTKAAMRILGEDAKRVTPEMLRSVGQRIGNELDKVEKKFDVVVTDALLTDLGRTGAMARGVLGDKSKPIDNVIDAILSRKVGEVIPADAAASLWRNGSALDRLTNNQDPDIAHFAQEAQSAVRRALNEQLPPDVAAAYSKARHDYRDFKIVADSLRLGENRLTPSRFTSQVAKRFPDFATRPDSPNLPMLSLGRAAGETWAPRESGTRGAAAILGALLGETVAPGVGGGVAGAVTGVGLQHTLVDSILRSR
jgi:hypothetical protein